jgi:hypothetical protein
VHQQCHFNNVELSSHLFASCPKPSEVWNMIFKWMGVMIRGWSSEVVKYFLIYQPVQRKDRKRCLVSCGSQWIGIFGLSRMMFSLTVK